MEDIIIRIKGDPRDIDVLAKNLHKLKETDADNAKQFHKSNEDFKKQQKEKVAAVQGATGSVNKALGSIGDQLRDVGKTLIAAFAVQQIISFAGESVKAFQEAELNAKKLEFALQNIGKEGGAAFAKLIDQSSKLQDKSIFSDDDIQRAQTQLVQFGLTSDEIEKLIPKILDLASATGNDLGQATDTVIMGVNGVTRGLKPLGLEFVNTGDKAQNLAIITDKLNKYQGQTEAILETSSGSWARWANKVDDAKESIGEFLLSYVDQFSVAGQIIGGIFDNLTGKTLAVNSGGGQSFLQKYAEASEEGKKKLVKQQEAAIKLIEKTNDAIKASFKTTGDVSGSLKGISTGVAEVKRMREEMEAALHPKGTNLGLTEEEKLKREAAAAEKSKKILEDRKKSSEQYAAMDQDLAVNKLKTIAEKENDAADAKDQSMSDQMEKTKTNAQREIAINKEALNQKLRDEKAAADEEQAIEDANVSLRTAAIDAMATANQIALNLELSNLQEQLDAKQISQEEFDLKSKEAKQSAAENDKALAIFRATIDTATAIIKMLANPGGVAGVILSIAAGITGAAQIGLILSQPVPQFAKGTEFLKRGSNRLGTDTIPIMANEGEAIIPANRNKEYPGLAAAWIRGNVDDLIKMRYIMPALASTRSTQLSDYTIDKLAKAIVMNQSGFYDGNLIHSDTLTRGVLKDQSLILRRIADFNSGKSILRKRGFNV